jgi:hypothetical protein
MLTAIVINNGQQMLHKIQNLKTALISNLTQYLAICAGYTIMTQPPEPPLY